MENSIQKDRIYRHYKGKDYLVKDVVMHSETLEKLVFYECLYENELGKLWVRPIDMFLSKVTIEGQTMDRFALQPVDA